MARAKSSMAQRAMYLAVAFCVCMCFTPGAAMEQQSFEPLGITHGVHIAFGDREAGVPQVNASAAPSFPPPPPGGGGGGDPNENPAGDGGEDPHRYSYAQLRSILSSALLRRCSSVC